MQLIILIGIQASGKTTYYLQNFFDTHIRINLDMIKTRHRESILFNACLESQTKCVIDNTNPTKADRARYIKPAVLKGFQIVGYFFLPNIELSIRRNEIRKNPVPEVAIFSTLNKVQTPLFSEGYDKLFFIRSEQNNGFCVTEQTE